MWTRGFPSWGEAQGVEVRGRGGAVRVTQLEKLTGGPPRCRRLEASRVLGSKACLHPQGERGGVCWLDVHFPGD